MFVKKIATLLLPMCLLFQLSAQPTTTFWTHNCETFTGWTNAGTGNWALSTNSYAGTYSFETSGSANYTNNTSYILVSPSIDISQYSECKLTFYAAMNTEDTYDGAYIEASANGGTTWQKLYNVVLSKPYDGKLPSSNILGENLAWYNSCTWQQIVVDLKDFEGSTSFRFRISFGSDNSVVYSGMRIDAIAIYGYAKTYIYNSSPTEQVVFDNSYLYLTDPKFRASSDLSTSFNRFKVEINKSSTFSDIAYIQEFGGSYTGGTQYTLTCNQLNPPLSFEDNQTYYVRVAASNNNGVSWGKWSNTISFTWKATQSSIPQWYQATNYQFNSGSLSGVTVTDNKVGYQSNLSLSTSIASTTDDAHDEGTTYYASSSYCRLGYNNNDGVIYTTGLRFTNIQIPKNAQINKAFIVIDCYYPHNPGYGINNNVVTRIYAEDADNPATFSSGSSPRSRTTTTSYVTWNLNSVWYDHSYYETPSLTTLVQSLVNRSGWTSGNSMVFLIKDDPTNLDYREIRTIDSDPSHAPKLYIEYQNSGNGTITSSAITLASIHGATSWGRLIWDEEGTTGDFRVTIQRWNGSSWVNTALSNLDFNTTGIDLSSLGAESRIRLVGTFIPVSGQAPILKSWMVTTTQLSGNSDLTLSLNASNLTPCKSSKVTFSLLTANNGPDEASNIVINFPIPTGLSLNNHSVSKGSYVSGQWRIPFLQNGETATMDLTVTVGNDQGGNDINVTASIASLLQTDPNLSNNSVGLILSVYNNTAPIISTILDQQTLFNTPFSTINFTVTDAETSSDALSYTAKADNSLLIPSSSMIFGGSGINRTLSMTPGNYQYGTTTVTITVEDGMCPATVNFNAQVVRHQFSNMEAAKLVVGQPDFTTTESVIDASHSPGASSCVIGALGHLAVGSQHTTSFGGHDGRVMVWNSAPTTNGQSCNVVVGKSSTTSSTSGCTQSLTRAVDGVAFSADGTKLLVSDRSNNRVLIWNTIPTTTGQPADVVIGQNDFVTNTVGCAANKLNAPRGLFVSSDGKLFIVDGGNNRVLIFNSIPTTNGASANIVIGQDDFVTNTRGNSAKKLYSPWYCTMSTDGKLLIADTENNRVMVYNSVPQQNGAAADYVIGQEDFGISSAGLAANKLNSPIGVTVSPSGILAIGEYTNNRVLIFNTVPQTNGASADKVLGQNNFTTGVVYNDGSGNSASAANNNLYHPYNIYFDINDRLFVNGREMNRVLVFGETPSDQCDLQVTIISDTDTPCMGNPVTYTIEAKNNGPQNSTNVVVYAALPSGFYYYDHSAERGTYSPTGGNWQIPVLNSGETVSLAISGTVNYSMGGATIQAFASVRSNNQAETNYANNSVSKTMTITNNYSPVVSRIADQKKNVGESTGIINFTVFDENGDPIS
ncbi:MAG TPA: hypothetical protein PK990_07855, partial [Salinivirgaceae bacterium]|nr:hypothetical protein [Salinivirgaceae bacterium]